MKQKDYYKILGVSSDASSSEIRTAYRNLAKQLHPDINKSPAATEKFKEINEAAETLLDEQKRQNYDQTGSSQPFYGFDSNQGGFRFYTFRNGQKERDNPFEDFMSSIFDNMRFEEEVQESYPKDKLLHRKVDKIIILLERVLEILENRDRYK